MNYLILIRQFWKRRKMTRFSNAEADLFFYLIEVCNDLEWQNPFPHPNVLAIGSLGISEEKLADARNGLKQKGLIDFIPGEKNKRSPIYTIFYPLDAGKKQGNEQGNEQGKKQGNEQGKQPNIKDKQNKTNISPEKKNSSGEKNTQKSGKGAKSEKPESAARVKTHKIERNPLWMKHWADFQESYPKTYRTDWKKAEELFAELLHKDGLNDDETVGRRGRWLVTQAHFYGELCKYEHREEQFVKAADKWLADEDEYKRDYRKIIDAMPKNGRGSPMPEGMVL